MKATLQIVGNFYSKVDLEVPEGATVEDVLDAAAESPGGNGIGGGANNAAKFSYLSTGGPKGARSVSAFSVTYDGPVQSRVLHKTYPAGTYFLAEHLSDRPAYTVWQYYIVNAEGVTVNLGKGPIPYNRAQVPDGGKVIWRLVQILAGPNDTPTKAERMLAGNYTGRAR